MPVYNISNQAEKTNCDPKIRLAFYGDAPTCITGFATVSRNILMGLWKTGRFDIDVYGINYWGEPHDFPFNIWPVGINHDLDGQADPFGREKIINLYTNQKRRYDIYFFLNNPNKLSFLPTVLSRLRREGHRFSSIVYYPVDATPKREWLENTWDVDRVIAYSEFGKRETLNVMPELESKIGVISHGVEPKDIFPLPKTERLTFKKQYFGADDNTYIITNVNRNQPRKDIPRTMMAFKEFKKEVSNSILYLHMAPNDVGGNLLEMSRILNLEKDIIFPGNHFNPSKGTPTDILNKIYNASDLIISTSTGEGWGLSSTEAMASKRPCLFPDHTSFSEIFADGRGILLKTGCDKEHYAFIMEDPLQLRPVVHIDDMVKKMLDICHKKIEVNEMVEKSYRYVMDTLIWEKHIIPKWIRLIDHSLNRPAYRNERTTKKDENCVEYI